MGDQLYKYENSVEGSSKSQDHPLYPLLPDKMALDRDKTGAHFHTYPIKTHKCTNEETIGDSNITWRQEEKGQE